jgi:uncharacterized membrane protein
VILPPSSSQPGPGRPRKRGFWSNLRNTFLAGIAVLLPAAVTAWLFVTLWGILDEPVRGLLKSLGEKSGVSGYVKLSEIPGLGLVMVLAIIFLAGFLARSFLGSQLIRLAEYMVERLPLIRTVYNGVKQLSDAIFTKAGTESFSRAVLVKFMGEDAYAVGFVTGETKGEAQAVTPEKVVNVFVPTTPNPTSGYLLMVPEARLISLQMTVEQAIKTVISGGMVAPPAPAGLTPAATPDPAAPAGTAGQPEPAARDAG